MAADMHDRSEYAMKFYVSISAFDRDRELYEKGFVRDGFTHTSLADFHPWVLYQPFLSAVSNYCYSTMHLHDWPLFMPIMLRSVVLVKWSLQVKLCRFVALYPILTEHGEIYMAILCPHA